MAQIVPVGRMLKIKVLVCLLFNWTLLIAKGPLLLAAPIMIVKGIKKYIGDPMRTHIAITLVIGLLAVLPVSSQQPQTTNPAALHNVGVLLGVALHPSVADGESIALKTEREPDEARQNQRRQQSLLAD